MALLTKIEGAIALGVGVELLEWFIEKCPKPGETRRLATVTVGSQSMLDETELDAFRQYLREPWPVKAGEARPTIPSRIRKDVKRESHLACAICGFMDNGEVAHITPVKKTRNNSPENLIFLCPDHHTKFDLGVKPASNVTEEEIRAAKLIKRQSRARMMRVEADVTKAFLAVLDLIGKLKKQINGSEGTAVGKVYLAEVKSLLKHSAALGNKVAGASKANKSDTTLMEHLTKHAPTIAKLSTKGVDSTSDKQLRDALNGVVEESREVLEALDEIDCPHCAGRGLTGLTGDYCRFCRGSQQVSSEKANSYDPSQIDEELCPHCSGAGVVGLLGEYCLFCGGSQVVSANKASNYSPDELDERACPRCDGGGTTGLMGDFCAYCKGSCVVSRKKWRAYAPDEIDEVECPRCFAKGTTGLSNDLCAYCRGSQLVSTAKANAYDEAEIDEVACPHCEGNGVVGLNGTYCSFCRGSQLVSSSKAEGYDADAIDEVICPKCEGRGTHGYAGDMCKLCRGEVLIPRDRATSFLRRR